VGALNSNWLPDRHLLAETADWISDRLPWWLRFAPLLASAFLIALGLGLRWTRMPVPRPIPVTIQEVLTNETHSRLVLLAPFSMDLPEIGAHSVLRVAAEGGARVARATGRIESIVPTPGMLAITLSVNGYAPREGSGTLLVPDGSETLWNIFMRKIQ